MGAPPRDDPQSNGRSCFFPRMIAFGKRQLFLLRPVEGHRRRSWFFGRSPRRAARKIATKGEAQEGSSSEGGALRAGRTVGHSVAKAASDNQRSKTRIGKGIRTTLGSRRLLVVRRLVCVFHSHSSWGDFRDPSFRSTSKERTPSLNTLGAAILADSCSRLP